MHMLLSSTHAETEKLYQPVHIVQPEVESFPVMGQ